MKLGMIIEIEFKGCSSNCYFKIYFQTLLYETKSITSMNLM